MGTKAKAEPTLYRYTEAVLYRYREQQIDGFTGNKPVNAVKAMRLYLDSYPVIKTTPCGCWIDRGYGYKKFVNLNSRKKWAHESIEDAMQSFIARKESQVAILRHQLLKAESALLLQAKDALRLRCGMYQLQDDPTDGF